MTGSAKQSRTEAGLLRRLRSSQRRTTDFQSEFIPLVAGAARNPSLGPWSGPISGSPARHLPDLAFHGQALDRIVKNTDSERQRSIVLRQSGTTLGRLAILD
jgi:hypothetical protein